MTPDLPEKSIGIDITETGREEGTDGGEDDEEAVERFLFLRLGDHRLAAHVDDVKTTTDAPTELTRVPRSPQPIVGLTDLRGDITAVIDTRVHFPVDTPPGERQKLIVFDRRAEQQSAGIVVDGIEGVETIPVRNVRGREDVNDREVAGSALEHPLVEAVVEKEKRPELDVSEVLDSGGDETDRESNDSDTEAAVITGDLAEKFERNPIRERVFNEPETSTDSGPEPTMPAEPERVVVETAALLDVDRLLLASGQAG